VKKKVFVDTMRKNGYLMACLLAVFYFAAPAHGQRVWEKKPYQQWSLREALKILTDSPWARTVDILKRDDPDLSPQARLNAQNDPYPSELASTVRLRSGLPLRQAFVRHRQLRVKYDKLGAAEKAKFDAEVKEFLECPPCATYYIVTREGEFLEALAKIDPKNYSLDGIRARAHLANDKGERRECVHVRQENQELLFFFRRLDDRGKPLITPDNKEFYFAIQGVGSNGKLLGGTSNIFDVASLTLNGEIAF
jgi:hypothetical protein